MAKRRLKKKEKTKKNRNGNDQMKTTSANEARLYVVSSMATGQRHTSQSGHTTEETRLRKETIFYVGNRCLLLMLWPWGKVRLIPVQIISSNCSMS